jgi:hypothetical protein
LEETNDASKQQQQQQTHKWSDIVSGKNNENDHNNNNQNQTNTKITNSLIMDVSILYSEVLNKEIYTRATEYFKIENVYDEANYIHGLWYDLHKQGEKDILKILDNWHHRSIMNTHVGKTIVIPEEEHYLKIKQMVIDEYQNN